MNDTLPVLNHGVIGNGRGLALVAPDTGLEWLCMPRFDSPSVFGRLPGNFPQAYTHVGLIHAAITLGELLDARATRFRAWG